MAYDGNKGNVFRHSMAKFMGRLTRRAATGNKYAQRETGFLNYYNDVGRDLTAKPRYMSDREWKQYQSFRRRTKHEAASVNPQSMDASTRKAMKSHYYRENRRANGLSAG